MTITLGYTTLANVSAALNPNGLTTNATDDAVIERLVEGASRWIDTYTGRTFSAAGSSARLFDVPDDDTIWFDADLYTTAGSAAEAYNGDGTDYTASVRFLPTNGQPKYAVTLKDSAAVSWSGSASGDDTAIISINGWWCYSATAPHDIRMACESIVISAYKTRYGQGVQGAATVTAAGVIITPQDVPAAAIALLQQYKRTVLDGA